MQGDSPCSASRVHLQGWQEPGSAPTQGNRDFQQSFPPLAPCPAPACAGFAADAAQRVGKARSCQQARWKLVFIGKREKVNSFCPNPEFHQGLGKPFPYSTYCCLDPQAAIPIPTLPESFQKDFKGLFSLLSIALPNNPCEGIATVQFNISSMNYS